MRAASATYTALLMNPDDKMLLQNMEFYMNKLDNNYDLVMDLEQKVIKFYEMNLKKSFSYL